MHGKPNMKTKDIEYTDEWGNKHVLTSQRAKEIMHLAESISQEANGLADLYNEAGISPKEILGELDMIDIQVNPA